MVAVFNELGRYWLEGASQAAEGMMRTLRDPYPIHDEPKGATPFEIVHEGETLKLRHYRAIGEAHRTPLLVVYALVKRPFILDLLPGRSVIETLTHQGFDVYLTDWVPPTREDSWRGFDDYVNCELHDGVRAVQKLTGVKADQHVRLLLWRPAVADVDCAVSGDGQEPGDPGHAG